MSVGGVPCPSLPGAQGATLIEGTTWAAVPVTLASDTLTIAGADPSFSGLAGLQLVPFGACGLNVDFGLSLLPATTFGAASGQAGRWNTAGPGATALLDLAGIACGARVDVLAASAGVPVASGSDDERLLGDCFYDPSGVWSARLSGIAVGDYLAFLYAPSDGAVATGLMAVGTSVVSSMPGEPASTLVHGTSWDTVPVSIVDGTLDLQGLWSGPAGLAGVQLVPVAGPSYCTPGTSASGCAALLTGLGAPSATAPSGFTLLAEDVEGAKDGLFFFGTNGRQANPWGNGGSVQCVVPPVKRCGLLIGVGTSGQCDGSFVQDLNALWCPACPGPAKNPGAGATVQIQLWYRDPLNTSNQTTSLSDAIEVSLAP
jgi:hypothetical protein